MERTSCNFCGYDNPDATYHSVGCVNNCLVVTNEQWMCNKCWNIHELSHIAKGFDARFEEKLNTAMAAVLTGDLTKEEFKTFRINLGNSIIRELKKKYL